MGQDPQEVVKLSQTLELGGYIWELKEESKGKEEKERERNKHTSHIMLSS